MKIRSVDTLVCEEFPNILFLEIVTDEGIVGLGETFLGARAVEAYIHETAAHYLLGKNPLDIQAHATALRGYLGYGAAGVESRGNSAIDLALWDLLGKSTGVPLYTLLGGLSRTAVPIYNTCAGYQYIRSRPVQAVDNWGLPAAGQSEGPYEDLQAFLTAPGELARDLLGQGITGMKIWPFDRYAESSNGQHISNSALREAIKPFETIRNAVDSKMDLMVELHGLWNLPCAVKIARALEEFEPAWIEDPIRTDNLETLVRFNASTSVPIALSETLSSCRGFRGVIEHGATDIVILDVGWSGGITEATKIAALADTHYLPIAPHDCTGPVVLAASAHLSASLPNGFLQETVRAYYSGWYRALVKDLPRISNGFIAPGEAPGLGVELHPELRSRSDVRVKRTSEA